MIDKSYSINFGTRKQIIESLDHYDDVITQNIYDRLNNLTDEQFDNMMEEFVYTDCLNESIDTMKWYVTTYIGE